MWGRLRVVHGPVVVGGLLARNTEAFTVNGGHLQSAEVWCGHCWGAVAAGPSFREVAATPPATPGVLAARGVPAEPFPAGYEPLASCCLCAGTSW